MGKFVLCGVILTVFCAGTVACAQDYRLGSDDALKITVYREEELDRNVRVSSDGYISLPLLGKVKAESLTVSGTYNHRAGD